MILSKLSNATFIIPLHVDSIQRIRNAAFVIAYLTTKLDSNIIVKEVGHEPRGMFYAWKFLGSLIPSDAKLQYLFERETRTDGVFHRTKVLNDMVLRTMTPCVINYDVDVLLPVESYYAAVDRLLTGKADVVYPYAFGPAVLQKVFAGESVLTEFVANGYSLKVLDSFAVPERAEFGFCQFFRREAYISGYLENENFISYGPEDVERYYRFCQLGYTVERLSGPVYHLEHPRTPNSSSANPFMVYNLALWERLKGLSPEALYAYYERQSYVRALRLAGTRIGTIDLSRRLRTWMKG